MRRGKAAMGLLSGLLTAAFFVPMPVGAQTAYREIAGQEALTAGNYVLVLPEGGGLGTLDGETGWVNAAMPVVADGTVTDAADAAWSLSVSESGVTLTDSSGTSISPVDGGESGIAAGTYVWQVSWQDGLASFHGLSGAEPVTLAANRSLNGGFLSYLDTVIAENPEQYLCRFRLYREVPAPPEEPEEIVLETVGSVAVTPDGGEILPGETIPLYCETPDAVVYVSCSQDGESYPPFTPYTEPLCPEAGFGTLHLRAYAAKEGCADSALTERTFTEKTQTPQREWNLYFGQLHAHTNLSDGRGSVEEAFAHAANVEGLDFFAVTDHSDSFDNAASGTIDTDGTALSEKWAAGKAAAAAVTEDTFVGIFGYEMTWPEAKRLGHLNTFHTPGWQTRDQAAYGNPTTALEAYYRTLASVPASVSQFNHPGTLYGDFENFGHYSPEADAVISLLEVAGEDGITDCRYYNRALDKGWHVAPTNNQTNHNGSWGDASGARTVALAKALTEDGLYDAMKHCRVYATEDRDLSIYYELNGAIMGSVIPKTEQSVLRVSLEDPTDEAIGEVTVIADGGAEIARRRVQTASDTLELSVPGGYSYYYLRVTQPDGDVAVTAPVWLEGYDDVGIGSFTGDKTTPVQGEEVSLTVELYNHEPVDFLLESLEFFAEETRIAVLSAPGMVPAMGTLRETVNYTHSGLGVTQFRVAAVGTINGERRSYEQTLSLSYRVPELVRRIAVDSAHGNAGSGNGNRLTAVAAEANITVEPFSGSIPENAGILLITAPAEPFDEAFVAQTAEFAQSGGTVILCGQADLGDWSVHSACELNRLLAAMGATVRLNDDTAWDEVNNGGTADKLYTTRCNETSDLCRNWKPEQVFSQRSGCTVSPGLGTWLVKGLSTTHSRDMDGDSGSNGAEPVLMAWEALPGGGCVYVSGGLFLGDREMEAPDNLWDPPSANQTLLETILGLEQAAWPLCTVAQMRGGQIGQVYHIRGWATSGTSHPGNVFENTLYLQDDTGGVALMPFTETGIQIGTPIEAIGQKEVRGGNVVLKIMDYQVLDEPLYRYAPETSPNKTAMNYASFGGSLMQVEGKVTDVTYTADGKGVARFTVRDDSGDLAEVLIEAGIVSGADGENALASQVKKGRTVRTLGIVHLDSQGTPVLRVRNCDEVVYVPPRRVPFMASPQTGDRIGLAVGVTALSLTGLGVMLRKKRK
ncbi:MAG: CehA/McbA family metallohydrolase [Firmicutes bacterium]|nr:CehA/McbA family metallohydrolase [Bacillota bacterium]